MKKIGRLFMSSLALSLMLATAAFSMPRVIYSIKTKISPALPALESLPAYYKGYKIDLRDGRAELPECKESQIFSIIFTENVDFSAKGNNVRYLKRIKKQPYSWYDLTLHYHTEKVGDEEKRVYTWEIEKQKEEDVSERIPDHALVVLTNPDFIQALEPEPVVPGTVDVVLPTILFKTNIDPEELKRVMLEVLIGPALDLDAIHSKNKPPCVEKDSVIITSIAQRSV